MGDEELSLWGVITLVVGVGGNKVGGSILLLV